MLFRRKNDTAGEVRRSYGDRLARWGTHAGLGLIFLTAGGLLMVWPQWLAWDGARHALELQREREKDLQAQMDTHLLLNERLRDWQQNDRRVLLRSEVPAFPKLARQVVEQQGARLEKATVGAPVTGRWRRVTLSGESLTPGATAGEIAPQSVHLVINGSFDAVYRAVAALSRQQCLYVPEQWELAVSPAKGRAAQTVRASIRATVFVVTPPETEPQTPPQGQPVLAGALAETEG